MAVKGTESRWDRSKFDVEELRIGAPGSQKTLTGTEIGYLDGLTAGTATASKAVVLGASKEIATITTATITNLTVGASTVNATDRLLQIAKVAALTATGNAGMLSWANPEGATIIVTDVILDVTTQATGTPTVDIGVDADGTGTSDTIIDGAAVGAAVVKLNSRDDAGTNGGVNITVDSGEYITCTASADPAGLVGSFYIFYFLA